MKTEAKGTHLQLSGRYRYGDCRWLDFPRIVCVDVNPVRWIPTGFLMSVLDRFTRLTYGRGAELRSKKSKAYKEEGTVGR